MGFKSLFCLFSGRWLFWRAVLLGQLRNRVASLTFGWTSACVQWFGSMLARYCLCFSLVVAYWLNLPFIYSTWKTSSSSTKDPLDIQLNLLSHVMTKQPQISLGFLFRFVFGLFWFRIWFRVEVITLLSSCECFAAFSMFLYNCPLLVVAAATGLLLVHATVVVEFSDSYFGASPWS